MSFQWIIDQAETISLNRKKVVSSTTARDGTTRAVSRGNQPWRFEVKLPDGIRWTDIRNDISKAEALDRVSTATISANHTGQDWIFKYQGNSTLPQTFSASWTQGSTTVTITSGGGTTSSGYKFKAGDFIQLGTSGGVYTVAADVAYNSNSITVHRAVVQSSGTGTLKVGDQVSWTVLCTQFPEWTLFARDQVSWNGAFVFVENLV